MPFSLRKFLGDFIQSFKRFFTSRCWANREGRGGGGGGGGGGGKLYILKAEAAAAAAACLINVDVSENRSCIGCCPWLLMSFFLFFHATLAVVTPL